MENWIKLDRSEGTGDSEVNMSLDYNTTPKTRKATLQAKASGGGGRQSGNCPGRKLLSHTILRDKHGLD